MRQVLVKNTRKTDSLRRPRLACSLPTSCRAFAAFALLSLLVLLPVLRADELPIVNNVEPQPLAAQVTRLLDSLDMLGDPLPKQDADNLHRLAASGKGVEEMQRILDKYCLAGVNINPESRVKVQEGAGQAGVGGTRLAYVPG